MTRFQQVAQDVDAILSRNPQAISSNEVNNAFEEVMTGKYYVDDLNDLLDSMTIQRMNSFDKIKANSINIFSAEASSWDIVIGRFETYTLNLVPCMSICGKLNDAPTDAKTYQLIGSINNNIFDRNIRLTEISDRPWLEGEIRLKPTWQFTDKLKFDRCRPPIFLLLTTSFIEEFEWIFNETNLTPVAYACVRPDLANLDMVFEVLSACRSSDSLPFVRPYLKHRLHFLRWEAIKAICAIDEAEGVKVLELAKSIDPHSEVRQAAEISLKNHGGRF